MPDKIGDPSRPLVSVCIGVYNRERYIRECIDSVLAQTYRNFELVVVDDASTDASVEILKTYGDTIRLIERKTNSGMCQITRNQATRESRGEFIAYLDSDDAWYPDKLARQVAFFVEHPDIDFCHTYAEVIDGESRTTGIRHQGIIPATGDCFRAMLKQCVITISSVMVRRRIFDRIGYFNEDPFWRIGEDTEFFYRVTRRDAIGFIPEVLTRYRKSDAGITARSWRYTPRVLPIHEWLLRNPDYWQSSVRREDIVDIIRADCIENTTFWRNHGKKWYSVYHASKHIRYNPFNFSAWMELVKSCVCR